MNELVGVGGADEQDIFHLPALSSTIVRKECCDSFFGEVRFHNLLNEVFAWKIHHENIVASEG